MGQFIRSRTDWKERVVFRLAWITASRWSEIAALTPNNFTLEPDGTLTWDWPVASRTARADPHRAFRSVGIRGQDAFDTIKLCRTLQENKKLTNLTTVKVERALAPWNTTAHSIKRGALRHAAQIVETHNLDPHGDLAVGKARRPVRPSPEHSSIFGEIHHNDDPGVVAGCIDVKGETAEGQEPWLRAEERFFFGFHSHSATITRLMQVWGLVGRSPFSPFFFTLGKSLRRTRVDDARLLKEAGIIEDALSATTIGWITAFWLWMGKPPVCNDDGLRSHATGTETSLMSLMLLLYAFPII
ncbi:trans-sialidase [Trypanosoma cruzi]|uniref:Trans-sialidase n=1 Tax=Trypanosoma cruzi TaxID=5693 RepID=A0A7J6XP41_TRYCR|nr:trans-sialidase [Trypanosoma cruzi]